MDVGSFYRRPNHVEVLVDVHRADVMMREEGSGERGSRPTVVEGGVSTGEGVGSGQSGRASGRARGNRRGGGSGRGGRGNSNVWRNKWVEREGDWVSLTSRNKERVRGTERR